MPSRIVVFGATGYTGRLTRRAAGRAGRAAAARRALRGAARGAGRAARRARVAGRRRRPSAERRRAARAGRRAAQHGRPVQALGRAGDAGRDRRRRAIYIDSTGEPPFIRRVFDESRRAGAARRRDAAAGDGLRLRPGRARGRARARGRRRRRRPGRRRLLRARRPASVAQPRHQGVAGGRRARPRVRVPRRPDRDRALRRAGALVRGARQGPPGDLGRRRGALHASGRVSAAARGQRLPRLVRPGLARHAGLARRPARC